VGIYNYITKDQFFQWNPSLDKNCNGLLSGFYYCVANFASSDVPMPPTLTASASPTATGTDKDCKAWYRAVGSDNCESIALSFGTFSESGTCKDLSLSHITVLTTYPPDFISWNPSVYSDCTNIKQDTYYCVAIPGTPTTRTEPAPTLPGGGSTPTQSGIASDCTRYWLVSRDDTCESILTAARVASIDLHNWNPALGSDCKGLEPGYYVCISTEPVASTTRSTITVPGDGSGPTRPPSTTTTATSTGKPVTTPTPHIPGMVGGCVRFFFRGPDAADMYCQDLADAAGISLE
jgi:hypothetical protein